ncbi:LOW QUALITY PROTEIN: unextended protein-like [Paramacrobiotus metropolitanus]|uniref:LOW QUALITY PROTEIN: unextended protein-like n=1 Tax=Paramacrobiotus metropolitanus TaxID=2943436 RepID=UPI002445692B|nr:LOW QUALITY PROTEIN: unextended protein-like [Paramacrobiotus metropolitanus]
MAIIRLTIPSIVFIIAYGLAGNFRLRHNVGAESDHQYVGVRHYSRQYRRQAVSDPLTPSGTAVTANDSSSPIILGFRLNSGETILTEDGAVKVLEDTEFELRVFGIHFGPEMSLAFTTTHLQCDNDLTERYQPRIASNNVAVFTIKFASSAKHEVDKYSFCIKLTNNHKWTSQKNDSWMQLHAYPKPSPYLLPLWLQILLIMLLLTLSGLFSGLNLGLLTLDVTELKIVLKLGSPRERSYAKAIMPIRKKGNFLLCTLLFGNVLVNTTLTILMDDLTSGLVAVIGSTMAIVIFGEIVPQAICSRHGMAVGANTIWLTKFFMLVTFPLSYPISRILDYFLGAEIGHVYNRERLMELIKVTHGMSDLEQEEVNIISGALELKRKNVAQIMTPLNEVFMISYDAMLNFDTVSEIMRQGFTRVPVFDGSRTNVVALLNIKDLALVDPDDSTPVKTLCKFYNHHVRTVFDDTTLDVMLEEFKKGRSHMAFVQRVTAVGDLDPVYETVGVVTLEDVIEEIIQSEIEDEMDTTAENRRRLKRRDMALAQPQAEQPIFSGASAPQYQSLVTPQLQLATFQFLSTTLDPFREEIITTTILRRLLRHTEAARFWKLKDGTEPPHLYTAGRPADYFILILEGRIEVKVGTEHLLFQSGPFTYFGISVLNTLGEAPPLLHSPVLSDRSVATHPEMFIPDFTVYPVTDLLYLQISRAQYIAAYRASIVERGKSEIMRDDGQGTKRHSIATLPEQPSNYPSATPILQKSVLANSNVSLNNVHLVTSEATADGALPSYNSLEMQNMRSGSLTGATQSNGPVNSSQL